MIAVSRRPQPPERPIPRRAYGEPRELDRPAAMSSRAPAVGEMLPRAAEAFGVRSKLETYSLDVTNEVGAPKARGFSLILGITIEAIEYLEAQIMARVLDTPVCEVRENPPWGVNCVIDMPIRGIGAKADRVANVRTAWIVSTPGGPPRLVSAYIDV
ncbi:MAG: DUF6883 domain-containing protein [Solirubrobacterales bacterium]